MFVYALDSRDRRFHFCLNDLREWIMRVVKLSNNVRGNVIDIRGVDLLDVRRIDVFGEVCVGV